MKLEISNRVSSIINVMLEPIGDSFDIPVGSVAEIEIDSIEAVRLDLCADNQINIWTDDDVVVSIGNDKTRFSAIL